MSSTLCQTRAQAEYLASWEKRDILEQTFDIDRQRPSYSASGNLRRDGRLDLCPKEGYSGPDYCILVEPVVEQLDLTEGDMLELADTGYIAVV